MDGRRLTRRALLGLAALVFTDLALETEGAGLYSMYRRKREAAGRCDRALQYLAFFGLEPEAERRGDRVLIIVGERNQGLPAADYTELVARLKRDIGAEQAFVEDVSRDVRSCQDLHAWMRGLYREVGADSFPETEHGAELYLALSRVVETHGVEEPELYLETRLVKRIAELHEAWLQDSSVPEDVARACLGKLKTISYGNLSGLNGSQVMALAEDASRQAPWLAFYDGNPAIASSVNARLDGLGLFIADRRRARSDALMDMRSTAEEQINAMGISTIYLKPGSVEKFLRK